MNVAFSSWAAIAWISTVTACGSKNGEIDGGSGGGVETGNVISKYLGDGVQIGPYDDSGFTGPAEPNALNCDFNGPCCWKNAQPPVDQLEFRRGIGNVDAAKFQQNFGTSQLPSGDFLLVAMSQATSPSNRAVLYSCPTCGQPLQIVVVHYASTGVRLQACATHGQTLQPIECQDFTGLSGVPDYATLQGGEPDSSIAIVVSNFADPGGSIVLVDSIQVQGASCGAGCKELTCDFNAGLCNLQPGSGQAQWATAGPGLFRNPATGVRGSVDGTQYAATYLKPGETADMQVETALFSSGEKFLRFQEYKATEGLRFAGCCDSAQQCTYDTGGGVLKSDFSQWFQAGFSCPQGTKRVIFHAENKGNNEGAVGIDNLQVFKTAQDTEPLC